MYYYSKFGFSHSVGKSIYPLTGYSKGLHLVGMTKPEMEPSSRQQWVSDLPAHMKAYDVDVAE